MKRLILFGALCLPAFLAGCIHNDLPYPVVTINIEAIEAEGLDGAAQINAAQQTVILPLLETTDIRNVHITSVTLTEGGQSSVAFPGTFDLRTPLYTTGGAERSGMGFTIMESFMDRLVVRSTPSRGTTVVMRKRLAPRMQGTK